MEMRNFTPLSPLLFESEAQRGLPFSVAVLKGRFRINDQGPVTFLQPGDITFTDELSKDPANGPSSIIRESNLAPLKKSTDIHFVSPIAYSPDGIPAKKWIVNVKAGPISKTLRVTGRRHWYHGLFGWTLSEPEPVESVRVSYENALGGWWQHKDQSEVCKENPVGKGFVRARSMDVRDTIPAPQVESPLDPVVHLCQQSNPEGLGPIARGWEPRISLAGNYDDEWLEDRWPQIPDDFDFSHYNSAHPELVAPSFFDGTENFEVTGLARRPLHFCLPGWRVYMMLRYEDGEINPVIPKLDTVEIDSDNRFCDLVWRTQVLHTRPVRVVEARMLPGSELDDG